MFLNVLKRNNTFWEDYESWNSSNSLHSLIKFIEKAQIVYVKSDRDHVMALRIESKWSQNGEWAFEKPQIA